MGEAKQASDIIKALNMELEPASAERLPALTTDQNNLVAAMNRPKLATCSEEDLKNALKYAFTMVGLRAENFPTATDKELLHRHLRVHYGQQTTSELAMAFDLAVTGRLNIDPKDVKCYENFSIAYVSSILNAYLAWARAQYQEVAAKMPKEEVKALPPVPVSWRQNIEDAYQHFLSFGPERVRHFPVGFFDQLVNDGALKPHLWRRFMPAMRRILVGEAVRERGRALNNIQAIRTQQGDKQLTPVQENNIGMMQSTVKITELQEEKIKSGARDGELEVMAKQQVVLEYFKELKELGLTSVYKVERTEKKEGADE